ncbi:hypothetical protein ACFQDE_11335 [Deinococcus caeni]|uniref:hypothetical protein n=1 Tax=Deinococcus caeni TaxID=569127 RepID=UPI0031EAD152
MPKLIRKINRNRWTNLYEDCKFSLYGDSLIDLQSKTGKISFWKCDSDENIEHAVIALAVSGDSLDKIDYSIIEEAEVTKLGIHIENVIGKTPFISANRLHVDLSGLTVTAIHNLALTMHRTGQNKRKTRREVVDLARSLKGEMDLSKLSQHILTDIQ